MAIRFVAMKPEREGEGRKKIYFQALAPGPLIRIDVRQVGVEVRENRLTRLRLKFLRQRGKSLYRSVPQP